MMQEAIAFIKSRQPVNLILVLANILVFILYSIIGDPENAFFMLTHGAAFTPLIVSGHEYYRLFTCMFLHFNVQHLFNNMLVLFFIGDVLEDLCGKVRYLTIYLAGGIIGNIISVIYDLHTENYAVSAGASGAVFALIGALLAVVILNRGRVPQYTQRRMYLMAVLCVLQGLTAAGVDNSAHIGGMVSGFLLALLFHRKLTSRPRIPVEEYQE